MYVYVLLNVGDVTASVLSITSKTVNLEVEDMMLTTTLEVKTPYNLQCFVIALFSNTYICMYVCTYKCVTSILRMNMGYKHMK